MLEDELNEPQRAAVLYNEGPSLVVAGAGSGKTRVLTYKVAYLIQLGLEPQRILALTFTNKAAKEMKTRIGALVGYQQAWRLNMGTFHSIFNWILRTEAEIIGLPAHYTTYDTADSKNLLRAILKESGWNEKEYKPSTVLSRISQAKNHLMTAAEYPSEWRKQDLRNQMPRLGQLYALYEQRCRQAGAVDFDDMLLLTHRLFVQHPAVLEKYREQFQFILVDEYQDTNHAQHVLIKQLAEKHHRVCVVGDDAQSIYAFRGANIENMLQFTQTYPEARIFKLERNYRSSQRIVLAAGSLIAKNQRQLPKKAYSEKEMGEPLQVLSAFSDTEESLMIAHKIKELSRDPSYTWNDMAVLYRTNSQSRLLEEALRKANIPYVIYGGQSFYQRAEVKNVLAYLRLLLNPHDEEAFKRVVNYPARGIGDTTLKKLVAAAIEGHASLFTVAEHPEQFDLPVHGGTLQKLQAFTQLIRQMQDMEAGADVYTVVQEVVRCSGIWQDISSVYSVENEAAKEMIDELLSSVHQYAEEKQEQGEGIPRLAEFLSEVALLTDMDTETKRQEEQARVKLMTIHAAKGLEFKVVFVAGMEEDLFPNAAVNMSDTDMEEERRLMYVALTRAGDLCFMSYAQSRFRHGQMTYPHPSRFIQEIDARYVSSSASKATPSVDFSCREPMRLPRLLHEGSLEDQHAPATVAASVQVDVQPGMHIVHERFGDGEVLRVENTADGPRMQVRFEHAGERVLLLKFAKYKIIP